MNRKIGFLLFFFTICFNAISQEMPKNLALTLDLGGNSGLYSLNGEYKIAKINNNQVNARAGFGYCKIKGLEIISAPIGINLVTGTKKHHLELGLGASYIKGMTLFTVQNGTTFESEGMYFIPSIGYRFDKLTGGFIFKVYYSPVIGVFDFLNKEKFLSDMSQILNRTITEEELLYLSQMGGTHYPTIRNDFGYFGVSIGFRL